MRNSNWNRRHQPQNDDYAEGVQAFEKRNPNSKGHECGLKDVNLERPKTTSAFWASFLGTKSTRSKDLQFENREVVVLRFCKDFYAKNEEKRAKHGLRFWAGEGNSNHFFADVTHWRPIPQGPNVTSSLKLGDSRRGRRLGA